MTPAVALVLHWLTAVGAAVGIALVVVDLAGDNANYVAPVLGSAVIWVVGATAAISSLSHLLTTGASQYVGLSGV